MRTRTAAWPARRPFTRIAGVFFTVEEIETTWHDDNRGEWRTRETSDWDVIGDTGEAAKFCERAALTILRDFSDFPPEAPAGEPPATVYMRAAPALKAAL
jgi:hypothetical protein